MKNCDLVIEILTGNAFRICFQKVIILESVDVAEISSPEGKAAKEKLESLILGKKIYYNELAQDEHGRILAQVREGKKNINEEMFKFTKSL